MNTLFIASGPIEWASARLRCFWPAAYMSADVVEYDQRRVVNLSEYAAVIFQKVFDMDMARKARANGAKVYLDICDPVHWFDPQRGRVILPMIDGAVFSNEPLRADFAEWCENEVPTYTIPDRLELEAFPARRVQADVTPVRLIWFGLAANRIALGSVLANLERLAANGYPFELTIYDERPDIPVDEPFPVYHAKWSLDAENEVISSHDLALLPPYPGSWGAVKSNNRSLTAWASGLAVLDGQDYYLLARAVEDWRLRAENARQGYELVKERYQVEQSAKDWEALLCK